MWEIRGGQIYHRHIHRKLRSGDSTALDLNLRNVTIRCLCKKNWYLRLNYIKGKYNHRLPWMLPPINANGPQRQNGEIQVDKSQKYYNVKIWVKFTCHFCDHDWSTIGSSLFFKKEAKQNICKYARYKEREQLSHMFFKNIFKELKMLKNVKGLWIK